jgi:hypothetical protein
MLDQYLFAEIRKILYKLAFPSPARAFGQDEARVPVDQRQDKGLVQPFRMDILANNIHMHMGKRFHHLR